MNKRLLNRNYFVANLCFLYRLVVASEALLEVAAPMCKGTPLGDYYARHLEQERGHDAMLLEDLLRIGVTDVEYSFFAAQLAGSQYYFIKHVDTALLLGYMHHLEQKALTLADVKLLEKAYSVELASFRHHAEHDPAHTAELELQIAAQPAEVRKLIRWNESCVDATMRNIFDLIWDQSRELKRG